MTKLEINGVLCNIVQTDFNRMRIHDGLSFHDVRVLMEEGGPIIVSKDGHKAEVLFTGVTGTVDIMRVHVDVKYHTLRILE